MKSTIIGMLKEQNNRWLSGAVLCQLLGVSRNAVWKHISGLRAMGYDIEARANLGYRLISVPDLLLPLEITPGLKTDFIGQRISYHSQVASTNVEAKKMARDGCPQGTLVVAESQHQGKGRLGRGWFSPARKGLWFSLVLRPPVGLAATPQVTMVLAVAVALALRQHGGIEADIKWPNDILVQGKKICGILVELSAEMDQVHFMVAGIGLNVNVTAQELPEDIVDTATSLQMEKGQSMARVPLLQGLLAAIEKWYQCWLQQGFEPILKQWRSLCVTLQCPVTVHEAKTSYQGWALDVDETGALLVRGQDGSVQRLVAGEVSLRKKY